jgi:hypothetical protein
LINGTKYSFFQNSADKCSTVPYYLGLPIANTNPSFLNKYHGYPSGSTLTFTRGDYYIARDPQIPITTATTTFDFDTSLTAGLDIDGQCGQLKIGNSCL